MRFNQMWWGIFGWLLFCLLSLLLRLLMWLMVANPSVAMVTVAFLVFIASSIPLLWQQFFKKS